MNKYRRLTRSDRYQIECELARGKSVQVISIKLGFHRSNIYREIKRGKITIGVSGGKKKGTYSALKAHREFLCKSSNKRGFEYKGYKINGWVEEQIRVKLIEGWSPEQISNRLRDEKNFAISTEAIYKFILSCKRRGEMLHKYLRKYGRKRKRFKRRSRYWEIQYQRRKSIEQRPQQANKRLKAGHWERDLMLGQRGTGAILTAVDRKTNYTLLGLLNTTLASETNEKTAEIIKQSKLPCKTITNDNGHEFGEFWHLEETIRSPVYFTHALCPWERGTVENTIGLLRQYIPKGTNLNKINNAFIKQLEEKLNSRPRKKLGFKTPYEVVTGKKQKLITQKRIALLPPELYEKYYLTAEEIEKKRIFREKLVAMTG